MEKDTTIEKRNDHFEKLQSGDWNLLQQGQKPGNSELLAGNPEWMSLRGTNESPVWLAVRVGRWLVIKIDRNKKYGGMRRGTKASS